MRERETLTVVSEPLVQTQVWHYAQVSGLGSRCEGLACRGPISSEVFCLCSLSKSRNI